MHIMCKSCEVTLKMVFESEGPFLNWPSGEARRDWLLLLFRMLLRPLIWTGLYIFTNNVAY